MIPNDFGKTDYDLLNAMNVDPVLFEFQQKEDSKQELEKMYYGLPDDVSRFVMLWVYELGRSQTSCARATGRSIDTIRWALEKIKKATKYRLTTPK